MQLYDRALVWDNHACPPRHNAAARMSEVLRYRRAGVDVVGLNIGDSNVPLEELVRQAATIRAFIADHADALAFIRTLKDIDEAQRTGRTGILLNVEGSFALGGQRGVASLLFDIGVRWMAMVYNSATAVGCGVHDPVDTGLTTFGHALVAEMDRAGIIKCCSHTGYRTAMDVLQASEKPCIFSHSNPRALRDHPRNIPDELIRACAAGDGVIGINGVGIFLGDNDASVAAMVRHVDYVAQLVGARHVGLGLDYVFDQEDMNAALAQHADLWPAGYGYRPGIRFAPPEQIRELAEALCQIGYADADVEGVLGANLMRVAAKVWPA